MDYKLRKGANHGNMDLAEKRGETRKSGAGKRGTAVGKSETCEKGAIRQRGMLGKRGLAGRGGNWKERSLEKGTAGKS